MNRGSLKINEGTAWISSGPADATAQDGEAKT
jgi:hypothetical protein